MIRLGGGEGIFGGLEEPEAFARAHREFGFTAAVCPQGGMKELPHLKRIAAALEAEDVALAEVGCWTNLVHADEEKRRRSLDYAAERLAVAEELGARCCVTYLGSVAPDSEYDPDPFNLSADGFELAVATIRSVIDAVKPRRTAFALEMMQWLLPDSPESCLALIEAVDRPAFAVHLDPVNIIMTPRDYFNNGALIRRCFSLLGPHIVSCHAKDITLSNRLALHFDETPIGTGRLDYGVYLNELNKLGRDIPLILEHLPGREPYAAARDAVAAVAASEGIRLYGR